MHKIYKIMVTLTLLALLLAACGGGDSTDRHEASTDAPVEVLEGVCVEVEHPIYTRVFRCSYDDGTACMVARPIGGGSPAIDCNWNESGPAPNG